MTDLPAGWRTVSLGEICDVILGQSPPGSTYNVSEDGLPFFQGKAEFTATLPVVRKWTTAPKKIAPAGAVLLSVRAPVGPTNVAPLECAIGRGLAALVPAAGINRDFLLWAIRATADHLSANGSGSTFAAVTGDQVRAHTIPLAPTQEQALVVAELERRLSHVDAAVAGLLYAKSRLPVAKDALLLSLLMPGDRSTGGGLPELPSEWEWSTLGKVAEIAGGVTKDSKRQSDPELVEVPYLRVANVQRGHLDLHEVATIRVPKSKAVALRLEVGDILFNEGGDRDKLGRGWIWEGQVPSCVHQNHVFRARLSDDRLHPKFVSWFGNTYGRKWFEAAGKQTTNLASINLTTLKAFPIPVPPAGAVSEIVAEAERRMSLLEAADGALDRNLIKAEQVRRSLLHAAFSGALVPHDTYAPPASEIIEAIAQARDESEPIRRQRRNAS